MHARAGLTFTTALAVALAVAPRPAPAFPGDRAAAVPVLIELFTSEGCSSCPPADAVLTRLIGEQPVPGALIIGLEEHVDYWDHQGWRDPFSAAIFTRRQSEYAARTFAVDRIYTPQLVVGGRDELVGSDEPAARRAIERQARAGVRARVTLTVSGGRAAIRVETAPGASRQPAADVLLATTEDGLSSDVSGGENRGRHLVHTSVVRRLERVGTVDARQPISSVEIPVAVEPSWRPGALRLVAFVQERASGRIIGAATAPLAPEAR
jgi:hypothetical protein